MTAPLLSLEGVGKHYGAVRALSGVDLAVSAGEVACVLGDNGAGKSTLIKIIAGVHAPDEGAVRLDGRPVRFASPRHAIDAGIATVHQDLALAPLLPVWANLFLGREVLCGWGPLRRMDVGRMRDIARAELDVLGAQAVDVDRPVGGLSGGQRQCVAIARAIHFGAKVLVLDEPTAALGVRQAEGVLRNVVAAKARGLGVILITHNPQHAHAVGDAFLLLARGQSQGVFRRDAITRDDLARRMAGEVPVLEEVR
jgi:simple sugar transport system ATP-binding protein